MKKLLALPLLMFCISVVAQPKPKAKLKVKPPKTSRTLDSLDHLKAATSKYTDNVDDRMKGPNGEKIFIGPNGGRYYLKGTNKVYVQYGNKKKKG
jgi:hypothetical protein